MKMKKIVIIPIIALVLMYSCKKENFTHNEKEKIATNNIKIMLTIMIIVS